MLPAILLTLSLTVASCNKNYQDAPYTPPKTEQTITQGFDLQIGTETTDLSRSWDKTAWVFNYNQTSTVLTLTGTGASVGHNYTKTCTIDQLKAGTVSITMLPGNYEATFTTLHARTTDSFSANGLLAASIHSDIGDVLDIKIDNNLLCTGTPLTLTATLEDYLIIYDVPTETSVSAYDFAYYSNATSATVPRLLNTFYSTKGFHYAYMNAKTNYKAIPSNKVVDGTGFVNGNCYHIISPFAAASVLNIPDMIVQDVIVP